MTLEVMISEQIGVVDVFGIIRQALARLITWLKPKPKPIKQPDVKKKDDNKSPPDLGVRVSDQPSATESFG